MDTKKREHFGEKGKLYICKFVTGDLRGLNPGQEVVWMEIIGIKIIEQIALPGLNLKKKMILKWHALDCPNGYYCGMGNQRVTSEIIIIIIIL